MSSNKLLGVEPQHLQFAFELNKQITCTVQLKNKSDDFVAFKVKITNSKKYCVRPSSGVMPPDTVLDVVVTMQPQQEAPTDMRCTDKFLFQSVIANRGATEKNLSPDMFNNESGSRIEETKLKVVYVSPAPQPCSIREGIQILGDELPQNSSSEDLLTTKGARRQRCMWIVYVVISHSLVMLMVWFIMKKIEKVWKM